MAQPCLPAQSCIAPDGLGRLRKMSILAWLGLLGISFTIVVAKTPGLGLPAMAKGVAADTQR